MTGDQLVAKWMPMLKEHKVPEERHAGCSRALEAHAKKVKAFLDEASDDWECRAAIRPQFPAILRRWAAA
jgi:hypothetical protein